MGTIADIGILSFDFGKNITTGEGGAILTNNQKFHKIAHEYHDHGHRNKKNLPRGRDIRSRVGFNYRMTEMQAVIGKEQLKKLNFIIQQNKKRYEILENLLSLKFQYRKQIAKSTPIFDTFILFTNKVKLKKKILNILFKNKVGTKNLPDAIKWHCAYFWNHALDQKQLRNSFITKSYLANSIAIPILISKKINIYKKIAKEILSICE